MLHFIYIHFCVKHSCVKVKELYNVTNTHKHIITVFLNYFPRPIEEQMDYIQTTDVYRVLNKLPKGGNMHTHESKITYSILGDLFFLLLGFGQNIVTLTPGHLFLEQFKYIRLILIKLLFLIWHTKHTSFK